MTLSHSMNEEMEERLTTALMRISETEEGASLLAELFNIHGFVLADDEDYEVIRETAKRMNVDLSDQ